MNNLKAAKELVKRYESITLKEVKDMWYMHMPNKMMESYDQLGGIAKGFIARELTGYGVSTTCTLCKAVATKLKIPECHSCIYTKITHHSCITGINKKTYSSIRHSNTPKGMLSAYRKRAKYIAQLIKQMEATNV